MAKIYYRHIKAGTKTIDDVPDLWKSAVQAMFGRRRTQKLTK